MRKSAVTRDGKYKCLLCGHITPTYEGIKSHRRRHHSESEMEVEKRTSPSVALPIEPDAEPIGDYDWDELEQPLDEARVLRRVLKDAGLIARIDAITRHFVNHTNLDDIAFLDSLLRGAGASVPATKWTLLGWADHRRGGHDWVNAKYPEQAMSLETAEKIAEKKAAEQPKEEESPFKVMKNMLKEQMEMQQIVMMMEYMKQATGQAVNLNKKPKEEPKLRDIDGQFVKMTEAEFADYLMKQQYFKLQKEKMEQDSKIRLAQEDKKKESEKLPLRLEDGTIVNVPSDQVDKYLFMLKSTAPDQKKDLYELISSQEKIRQEMERAHQQQMQQLACAILSFNDG